MSPIRHERSVVHPRWLRPRWGWITLGLVTVFVFGADPFGGLVFPMLYLLAVAWILWRSDRDSGRN